MYQDYKDLLSAFNAHGVRSLIVGAYAVIFHKAARVLGVKTRTEAVHLALEEIVKLNEFKEVMKKYEGKLKFANFEK